MFGNGLRPQIWSSFVSRFNIPMIIESYASTEGMLYTLSRYGSENINKKVLKFSDLIITITAILISGNCNLANVSNQVGAVGFVPPFFTKIVPFGLIRVKQDTGEPERDGDGLCVR